MNDRTKIFFVNGPDDLKTIKKGALIRVLSITDEHASQYPHEVCIMEKLVCLLSNTIFLVETTRGRQVLVHYGAKVKVQLSDLDNDFLKHTP